MNAKKMRLSVKNGKGNGSEMIQWYSVHPKQKARVCGASRQARRGVERNKGGRDGGVGECNGHSIECYLSNPIQGPGSLTIFIHKC